MGVIAALAAALAAGLGAAIGGVEIDGWRMPLAVYCLGLLPSVAAVARWPRRPPLRLAAWSITIKGRSGIDVSRFGPLLLLGLALFALVRFNVSVATVLGLLLLAVLPVSVLWPRPGPLGAAVVLSGTGLLGPDASLEDKPVLVVLFVAAAAVALAARARLSHDLLRRFGREPTDRPRRVLTTAAAIFALALAAGLVASQLVPPRPSSAGGRGGGRSGQRPSASEGDPASGPGGIVFQSQLDGAQPRRDLGRQVVLKVESPAPSVWRTQAFDEWDGRTWRASADLRETAPVERLESDDVGGFSDMIIVQRFTVETPYLDVLAAAPEPSRADSFSTLQRDGLGTITPQPALGRGARYVVLSTRFLEGEELRAFDQYLEPGDLSAYRGLGPTSDRVRELAASITANAPTRYDKAQAVERWLAANVRFAEDHVVPVGDDLVDSVLFADRAATGTQLGTAMVMMLRSIDVPARLAIGFLPGQRGLLGGEFVVRADDAHTWVEVGFDVVWARFDPSGRIDDAARADTFPARLLRLLRRLAPLLAALAIVAIGLAAWRLLLWRRRRMALPWVTRYWDRLLKAGAGGGRPRWPAETPAEYTAALSASVLPDERWRDVGAIVTAAAFSGHDPPSEVRSWAERVLREAVAATRWQRVRGRLRRSDAPAQG